MGTGASIPAAAKGWTEAEAKAAGYTEEQIAAYRAEHKKTGVPISEQVAKEKAAVDGLKKVTPASTAAKSKAGLSVKAKVGGTASKVKVGGPASKAKTDTVPAKTKGKARTAAKKGSLLGNTSAAGGKGKSGKSAAGWAGKAAPKKKGGKKKKAESVPEPEPEPEPTPQEIEAAEQAKAEADAAALKAKEEAAARRAAALKAIEDEKEAEEMRRYQQEVARERRQREAEKKLVKAKADMIEAAFDGEKDDILKILDDTSIKVRVDETDENDYTSLSEAACAGHVACVQILLERGANPNTVGKHKRTPIWRAVYMNRIDCIQPLLDAGADPRKSSSDGDDAILLAKSHERAEITAIFEKWDPAKADKINADFEKKLESQKKRDELEEKAREFALTQCYSSEVSANVDNAAIEAMIEKLEANNNGEISLDAFIDGWSSEYPAEKEGKKPELLEFEGLAEALKNSADNDRSVVLVDPTQRASRFLQYNANVIDAKGLFILDKINGKPQEEVQEEMRKGIVAGMLYGKTLQFECQNTAPPFGEYEDEDTFPVTELFSGGWNKKEEAINALLREDDPPPPMGGSFVNQGVHFVFTTFFEPTDYKQFLLGGWPEFPFNEMDVYIVM